MDFDPETLLYIEGGRPYDPAAGRYLTAGSMASGTYNIYAFANNTPVDRSVRDVRGAGMQGIVGGSPIGAGTEAFFGSIGDSLSRIGNGVAQPFLNYYDFGRTLIDAGAELVGYHWNHESVSNMGQAAESGTTMLQLEMALLEGLGTNVADTVTLGGYATYQYRNGDINDSEYGDRILGVGLNFAGGAGLLKAAGLGKVTVAQASIGGVRAISTSVGRVVDVARKIEFNPQAITQVYSGIPVNMLRWRKVAEGFGMAAESIAPVRTPSASTKVINTPETIRPTTVKPEKVVDEWDRFLGPGPHTNIHPRTGVVDPDRIVSADGKRSIRYRKHESTGKPTKHHYHEETWTYDPATDTMTVDNCMVRAPYTK